MLDLGCTLNHTASSLTQGEGDWRHEEEAMWIYGQKLK